MNSADDAPAPTVWHTFQCRVAPALIDYYVNAFGFVRTAAYADGDQVAHAQLDWPEGGGIMLGSHTQLAAGAGGRCAPADEHKPDAEWSRQPGTAGAYVVTDDVDGLYTRVRAAGATITRELADTDYGSQEFAVADPEGNLWSFGSYRGEPRGDLPRH